MTGITRTTAGKVARLPLLVMICGTLMIARGAAEPKREQSVPFAAGETLGYDVSWSSYLTAGTATMRIEAKKPSYNSVAYYIVAEGRPTPLLSKLYSLYYKADTLLDVYSLRPQRSSVYSDESGRHRMKTTMFDQGKKQAEFKVETKTVVSKTVPISPAAQDPLGAMYVLRAIPLKPGDKITIPICDNGMNYKVLVTAGALEPIKTGIGTIPAQRLTLTPEGTANIGARGMAVWLSTDAARVPVKLTAQVAVGQVVLTLSSRK